MLYWIIAVFMVCSSLCVLYCIKPHPGSTYDWVRTAVLITFFERVGRLVRRLMGDRVMKGLGWLKHYVFKTNNPLTQIFYILLFPGLYVMFIFGLLIPYSNIYGFWHHFFGHGIVWGGFYTYYMACATDPGVITPENVKGYKAKYKKYEEGGLFRTENCATCKTPKPARSKHCSICNMCISRLDHHCIWIKGCVGEHNYKYFLGFIASHAVICFYGMFIALLALDYIVVSKDLWNQQFRTGDGAPEPAGFWIIFHYLFNNHDTPVFLLVLCLILAIALTIFTGYHLTLIAQGASMSESGKISSFTRRLERTQKRFEARVERYRVQYGEIKSGAQKRLFQKSLREKFDEEWKFIENEIEVLSKNYGERGLWKNFMKVMRA